MQRQCTLAQTKTVDRFNFVAHANELPLQLLEIGGESGERRKQAIGGAN